VTLADGGTVRLTWWSARGNAKAKCLLLPGLNTSSKWSLVQHSVLTLCNHAFSVAVLDYRGSGGVELTSPRLFGADSWRDLPEVLSAVAAHGQPDVPIFAVGHSMGGTILAKYLSSCAGSACPICAAVTVSAPLAISEHMRRLETTLPWRMANFLMASMSRLLLYRLWLTSPSSRQHLHGVDWGDLRRVGSLRALERATICRMNGFGDPEEYYAFSQPDIAAIRTPLLCIHARDDPLIGAAELPVDVIRTNPHIDIAITSTGGHLGYHEAHRRGGSASDHSALGSACDASDAPSSADSAMVRFFEIHCRQNALCHGILGGSASSASFGAGQRGEATATSARNATSTNVPSPSRRSRL
jgi:predicted alpha/beta-fold hydrolase